MDVQAGKVRLDAGSTKNGEGRVFAFSIELRRILEAQWNVAETLKREDGIITRYVFCYTIGGRDRLYRRV